MVLLGFGNGIGKVNALRTIEFGKKYELSQHYIKFL